MIGASNILHYIILNLKFSVASLFVRPVYVGPDQTSLDRFSRDMAQNLSYKFYVTYPSKVKFITLSADSSHDNFYQLI